MIWKTFTTLLLLAASTAASHLASSTTEKLYPSTTVSGGALEQSTLIKEEQFPAMAPAQAEESSQPIHLQPPPISGASGAEDEALRRRTVTYDQRQEGQYNIRADLENFMILLIPPGPQDGLSLLDILSRGSGNNKNSNRKSPQRSPSLKSFYQRSQLQRLQQQQQQQQLQESSQPVVALPEFIEGRTPYHVDISASDTEQAQRLQRQQVDVLPPQLIHMPQLIKPFHLEAEPELIQALPPVPATSSAAAGSKLLESYNQPGSHYFRNSRALRGDSYLETNRLAGGEYAQAPPHPRSISVPIYRSELSGQANALYPPIDAPAYVLNEARGSWQLDEEPTQVEPKHLLETDIISFDLLSDDLGDSKTLLRDGLARCARGERRDSYGACRQIEGY